MTNSPNLFSKAVVASGHELVTSAASRILESNGNAFDAVVAAGFAGAVVEQTLTSLGGGGFLLAKTAESTGKSTAKSEEIFFDFFVDTPGRGLEKNPQDPHFFPITVNFGGSDQIFNVGLGAAAVPGTLKGLLHVHHRLGRLPLSEVLQPAIEYARGHKLNDSQAGFLKLLYPIMTMSETGKKLYEPGGKYMQVGDRLVNTETADFLELLITDHGKSFYKGEIAEAIDKDMREGGGLLTKEDLAAYTVIERIPLSVPFHDYTLLTSPPPSLGGSLIGLSLSLMNRLPKSDHKWGSPEHLVTTTGLMQEVERLREAGITSPQSLEQFFAGEKIDKSMQQIRLFSRGTTHISIADSEGNVASMTCSNGEGCGYFAPGTGIMLNNMMGEDDLHPNGFHSSPPGERVGSMMSPSVLTRNGKIELVLGSGGSKRIRTAITQVLSQIIDFNRPITTAVEAPRLYWDDDTQTLQIEPGFSRQAIAAVEKKVTVNCWKEYSMYFGGVHTVIPGVEGAGDPRRGGSAGVTEAVQSSDNAVDKAEKKA